MLVSLIESEDTGACAEAEEIDTHKMSALAKAASACVRHGLRA
jgi:hypothetical protein